MTFLGGLLFLVLQFTGTAKATYYELRCVSSPGETGCDSTTTLAKLQKMCADRANSFTCSTSVPQHYGPTRFVLDSASPTYTTSDGNQGFRYRCFQGYRIPYVGSCWEDTAQGYFNVEPVLVDEGSKPDQASNNKCIQRATGSDINVDLRSVGETIPLVGVPFNLNYYSNLQIGYVQAREVVVGVPPGPNTKYPKYRVELYERAFPYALITSQTFTRPTTDHFAYLWDGKDSAGNFVRAGIPFTVRLYNIDASNVSQYISSDYVSAGTLNSATYKLGGWLPSNFSYLDNENKTEYFANGLARAVKPRFSTEYYSATEDGSEIRYYYENGDLHTIRSGLTGAILFTFAYNSDGSFLSVTDAFSQVTTFNYTGGVLTSISAPNGSLTSIVIDSATDRLSSVTSPNSRTYSMTYDSSSRNLLTFQKPRGDISTFTYDAAGKLTRDAHSGGFFWDLVDLTSVPGQLITQLKTPSGLTQNVTREKGMRTTLNADGTKNTAKFSSVDTTVTEGGVITKSILKDSALFGDQVQVLRTLEGHPSGASPETTFNESVTGAYDSDGDYQRTSFTRTATLNSKTTTSVYTYATKTWLTTSPESRTSLVKTDFYERPIEIQRGNLTKTELTYAADRLSKVKRGAREINFGYNATTKFLDSITNPLSQATNFTYDADGRVTAVTLPDLRVVSYGYDANGNVISIAPPGRPIHGFTINSKELVGEYMPPSISGIATPQTTYTYNSDKKLTSVTRPDASSIGYSYDSTTGKLNQVTAAGGTGYLTYNSTTGFLSSIRMPNDSQVVRTYSGLLPAHEDIKNYAASTVVSSYGRTFDSEGRIATETVVAGSGSQTVSFGYDNDGNLTTVGAETIAYDSNGLASGSTQGNFSDLYYYNSFGEVTGYAAYYSGTLKYFYMLKRDMLGRIIQKDELLNGITTSYCYYYDSAGRLVTVTKNGAPYSSIAWDDNGNRISYVHAGTTTTAIYDDQDRLVNDTVYSYTYNDNGELVSIYNTLTSQTTPLTFDGFGQLLSISWPGSSAVNFSYDGLGRQIQSSSSVGRGHIYDFRDRVVGSFLTANGNLAKRFVYGVKANIPDYWVDSSGTYRIVSDNLGSPRVYIRLSDGVTVGLVEHDEFGVTLAETNPGYTPFGFAGGTYEPNARVVHFGAREYYPAAGRWITKDPIGFSGGDTNLFGYVANDPINHMDPSGTGPVTGGIVCAVLEGANGLYNAGNFIIDNNNLTNEYMSKIQKLKGGGGDTCPENEEQIAQLQVDFLHKQKALVQSYMTPNLGRQALLGAACIAALLSPSP